MLLSLTAAYKWLVSFPRNISFPLASKTWTPLSSYITFSGLFRYHSTSFQPLSLKICLWSILTPLAIPLNTCYQFPNIYLPPKPLFRLSCPTSDPTSSLRYLKGILYLIWSILSTTSKALAPPRQTFISIDGNFILAITQAKKMAHSWCLFLSYTSHPFFCYLRLVAEGLKLREAKWDAHDSSDSRWLLRL